ncbi:MAG: polysaccharide pyruvyl transferase family protein [Phycisphaerales bacterium]|nr:polysaccharide pyruvyl transferase family protein [Phycisphaerales bacterium]
MRVLVWNGPTDNANLGCQALGLSLIAGIQREFPNADIWVSVSGSKVDRRTIDLPDGSTLRFTEFGASLSRNPIKAGNFARDFLALRILGPLAHSRIIGLIKSSDLAVDVSGGDSFTSLYGTERYKCMVIPKKLTLALDKPLVLAPQTFGPFSDKTSHDAAEITRNCNAAWGRDQAAADYLDSIGLEAKWCPDLAFTLPIREATSSVPRESPVIGFNISGLIWNSTPAIIAKSYGIHLDYQALMESVTRELLVRYPGHRILLVPHVQAMINATESDTLACHALCDRIGDERVSVAGRFTDSMDAKSAISKCDLMLGTRMHACVAGLSTGVPTIGFAYSLKTRPVFESVDMGSFVVDLRDEDNDSAMHEFRRMLDQVDSVRAPLKEASRRNRELVSGFFRSLHEVIGSGEGSNKETAAVSDR